MSKTTDVVSRPSGNGISIGCIGCPIILALLSISSPSNPTITARGVFFDCVHDTVLSTIIQVNILFIRHNGCLSVPATRSRRTPGSSAPRTTVSGLILHGSEGNLSQLHQASPEVGSVRSHEPENHC